jgi:hypothetical protein
MVGIGEVVVGDGVAFYGLVEVNLDISEVVFEEVGLEEQVLGVVQVGFFFCQFFPGPAVGPELPTNVEEPELHEEVSQGDDVIVVLNKLVVDLFNQVVDSLIRLLQLHRLLLAFWR